MSIRASKNKTNDPKVFQIVTMVPKRQKNGSRPATDCQYEFYKEHYDMSNKSLKICVQLIIATR